MTSQELHNQITAFVDNRVDEGEYRRKVGERITDCPDCGASYERDLTVRMVIRERPAAPESLRKSIGEELDQLSGVSRRSAPGSSAQSVQGSWLERFGERRSPVGTIIALALVVGGAVLFSRGGDEGVEIAVLPPSSAPTPALTSGASKGPVNFFNFASTNFTAILAKKLGLQVETDQTAQVAEFFKEQGVDFAVTPPTVSLPLVGGFVTRHGTYSLPHLIYADGDKAIYVFEIPYGKLVQGDLVYVTNDVLGRLDAGERIWEEPTYGNPMTIVKSGTMVVAIVSNASKLELRKLLSLP